MSDDAGQPTTTEARELLLMRAGAHAFAVYSEEADGVAAWQEPAPLPHAPPAVLGVVCVRGRMRTVLDPAALLGAPAVAVGAHAGGTPRLVVTLRGDEQLALAVDAADPFTPAAQALAPPPGAPAPFLRGTLLHDTQAVHLLDPAHLFDAATQGTERRRPRQKG